MHFSQVCIVSTISGQTRDRRTLSTAGWRPKIESVFDNVQKQQANAKKARDSK